MFAIPWYKYQPLKFALKFISTEIEIPIFLEIFHMLSYIALSFFIHIHPHKYKIIKYTTQKFF